MQNGQFTEQLCDGEGADRCHCLLLFLPFGRRFHQTAFLFHTRRSATDTRLHSSASLSEAHLRFPSPSTHAKGSISEALPPQHLYRISSIPIHKAFYETMERLAAVSSHAAVAVGRLGRNAAMAPQPKRSHLASSPTYSIFSIGRKQIRDSEWVLLDMMRDVLHNEKDVMRSTVATSRFSPKYQT